MTDMRYAWRPRISDPATAEGRAELERWLGQPNIQVIDALDCQVDDLLCSRHPALAPEARARARDALMGKEPGWRTGLWVHYPWLHKIVRTLPRALFREARLARNRNKITATEQDLLSGRMIGVVGLSVGRQIARTLAMEGVCDGFRLADRDVLSLSNLNRLPAGIADLGVPKVVLAARELFELDPFLHVEIHPEGLDADDLDSFLRGAGRPLDLVVEECDDFAIKIRLRERARSMAIPVLMETSEGGILDIERFDQEPERPLLHGLLEGVRPESVFDLEQVKALIARLLPHMRPRTRDSVAQVGTSLRSWPQLASEIALGAASVTTAARRILLGEQVSSGRYRIDLDRLLDRADAAVSLS